MVVLDTCVIIEIIRHKQGRIFWDELREQFPDETWAVSVITIQELYTGTSTRDTLKEQHLLSILGGLKVLAYSVEVATLAGGITRDLSHSITFADAAIAATAIHHHVRLATLNVKDFRDIPELRLVEGECG